MENIVAASRTSGKICKMENNNNITKQFFCYFSVIFSFSSYAVLLFERLNAVENTYIFFSRLVLFSS